MAGSGPAYAAMFIEAMADGGVLLGLPALVLDGKGRPEPFLAPQRDPAGGSAELDDITLPRKPELA